MTLAELKPGQRGRVLDIRPGGGAASGATPDNIYRLTELGLVSGQEVRVLRLAPLGDPIAIRLLGYELCLRKREARHIEVEAI